jgi:hypothetical protein
MVSEIQLIANKENANKGGVKTEAGKAAVRFNALKHGLLSQQVVLSGEHRHDFDELNDSFMAALQPEGPVENMLVDTIVSTYWRMGRLVMLETCYIQKKIGLTRRTYSIEECAYAVHNAFACTNAMANLNRYEVVLERKLYKALQELERLQMARKGERPPAPLAIDIDVSHGG